MDSFYGRALSEVGQDGKFQSKFDLIYNVVFSGLWIMAYYNIVLALTITPHMCKVPEKPDNVSEYLWKLKYIPNVKDAAGVEKLSDCLVYADPENNITKTCDIFDYDKTWFETTVPSENNWVCENELHVANIYAYSRTGEIVGSIFFGWFGDVYGRKLTYIISLFMLIVGRFMSVFASSSFVLFAIGCIIASFPSWSATQSTSIISIEIASPERRATVATLRLVATSFGMGIMPLFYWWSRSWKPFMILTTGTLLPYLLFSWKLIESPQWLWVNRKNKHCINILKQIADVNKTKLNPDTENEILTSGPALSSKSDVLGPLSLFSGWRLAFNTILQLFIWITVSVNYNIIIMSSAEKSNGNPFLDFAWQSLAEIPGYFMGLWLANRIGRRYTGMVSSTVTAFIWIIYGYREINNASWLKNKWLGYSLDITVRLSLTILYYLINLLNMELYPTSLRQSGMSLGNVVSGAASAVVPYIVYLGHRFDTRYPSVILTATTVFGGVLSSFFLPETLNVKLPETLEDAKRFGRSNRRDRTIYMSVKTNNNRDAE